ncbi:MAG: tRNA (5-methylaminomethyl-2-thiouridine)(34)-methyltransferase MnmD [Sulfitobacter sp.]
MDDQTADVIWREGGVPVSTRFDDPYFSLENGVAETEHVFLGGNDLPHRFSPGFQIAELGFGTGLNMLVAWDAWVRCGVCGPLSFTSFELFPVTPADMAHAHAVFPEFDGRRDMFLAGYHAGVSAIDLPGLRLRIIHGDARRTLTTWQGAADAWFLDGFSPAKNPQLWSGDLMAQVGLHTRPNGTCATYTAAGFVRRGLQDAGFEVSRVSGYGRKRHMTRGVKA